MKYRILTCVTAMTSIATLATPGRLAAQEHKQAHQRYKLIDIGTFGGPHSQVNGPSVINSQGTVVGAADTSVPDPYPKSCFDPPFCFTMHAFQWNKGILTDLGTLPGGASSYTNAINSHGQIVGQSENGLIDPLTGLPEVVATVWQNGQVIDLGALGLATADNDRDQVVGCAFNSTPDPFTATGIFYGIGGYPYQMHAFLWKGGPIEDLGTLGGPDSCAVLVNERNQIAGASFTNATANPVTGFPTLDPFLWEDGKMLDVGTLGGTIGFANALNNRGQVVGQSNLAGDLKTHPFLWDRGTLTDLGTFGGDFGQASWINDEGDVVGLALYPGNQMWHGFLWRQGVMTDLGTVAGDTCSQAASINSEGQVVGASGICFQTARAFLWEKGHMIDLNTFVPTGSGLQLTEAVYINDRGEIAGSGRLPNGDFHAVVLIPADGDDMESTTDETESNPAPVNQSPTTVTQGSPTAVETIARIRARLARRFHVPGLTTGPAH